MYSSALALAETCVASVSDGSSTAIPSLGSAGQWGTAFPLLALLLLAGGILFAIGKRHAPTRKAPHSFVAASALALYLALATFGFTPGTQANATPSKATPSVEYSHGCALIRVDKVITPKRLSAMLPGDQDILLEARVTNVYSSPVLVTPKATAKPDRGTDTQIELHAITTGAVGSQVRLEPGESAVTSLVARLPVDADNLAQSISMAGILIFSATEQ